MALAGLVKAECRAHCARTYPLALYRCLLAQGSMAGLAPFRADTGTPWIIPGFRGPEPGVSN